MATNTSTDDLLQALRNAERLSADARRVFAKAAESFQPQMDEIAKSMAPSINEFQRLVEDTLRTIDLGSVQAATEAVASSFDRRALEEIRNQAQELSAEFESLSSHLNSSIAIAVAKSRVQVSGRSLKNWKRRWGDDAAAAEAAFVALSGGLTAAKRHGDLPVEASLDIAGDVKARDVDIADLYYNGLLTQQQIGETVGLTQASVASRLKKIDRIIAREVLVRILQRVATNEGWDILKEGSVGVGGAVIRFDLLATKDGDEESSARLGIDIQVVGANTHWNSGVNRIQGWSEYLASIEPRVHPVLAIYDLSEQRLYLCLEADLDEAASRARAGQSSEPLNFAALRPFLQQERSLDAILRRAQG